MDPADIVLRFLESAGRPDEARFYLARFRAAPKEQFAAIAVDANIVRHAIEAVVLDLRFLVALGLAPVVVLGLFDSASAFSHAARIHRRLAHAGASAVILRGDDPELHEKAAGAARAGIVPLVALGSREGALPEDRVVCLGRLLAALSTRKLVFVHHRGGLAPNGKLVPLLALTEDAPPPAAALYGASRNQRLIVAQSKRLIFELVPHEVLVAMTSPLNLLRELFTVKGAGTLIRRQARIVRFQGWQGVDEERLRDLLTSSFGRPASSKLFDRPIQSVYLETTYRGAAILVDTPLGAYLTKFAVGRDAQGEGLGRDLWNAIFADCRKVFWRARPENPIVDWYTKIADGIVRYPEWTIFWKGLEIEHVSDAVAYALAQPIDLPARADGIAAGVGVRDVEADDD